MCIRLDRAGCAGLGGLGLGVTRPVMPPDDDPEDATIGLVARKTTEDLTDAELEDLLVAAVEDQREGRIVHCADKDELRSFLESVRLDPE